MKTIDSINVTNKRVLLRIDINSEIINGKIKDSPSFVENSKTINELKRRKAKVVILAHQSRPGKKDFTSLKQHAKILNRYSNVKFVDDIIGKKAVNEIKQLKPGEALLLDNVRKLSKSKASPGFNCLISFTAFLPIISSTNFTLEYLFKIFACCFKLVKSFFPG